MRVPQLASIVFSITHIGGICTRRQHTQPSLASGNLLSFLIRRVLHLCKISLCLDTLNLISPLQICSLDTLRACIKTAIPASPQEPRMHSYRSHPAHLGASLQYSG